MFHCVGPSISNVTTKADCLMDPRNRWVNHRYNFDNLGQVNFWKSYQSFNNFESLGQIS